MNKYLLGGQHNSGISIKLLNKTSLRLCLLKTLPDAPDSQTYFP